MKLRVHNQTVIIYSKYKFYEIPSIGYIVMAEDGRTEGRTDGNTGQNDGWTKSNLHLSALGGDNKKTQLEQQTQRFLKDARMVVKKISLLL